MDPTTVVIAEGIAWASSVLDAHDAAGKKLDPERYYIARAKIMVIEEKMYQLSYSQVKPVEENWTRFKVRLETHRPSDSL